jgi:uncharacterized protein (TIGR02599 family)
MELIVAMAVFVVMMGLVMSIIGQMSGIWKYSSRQIEAFQSARAAYDLMTYSLSQATLNTYLDYADANNSWMTEANASTFSPKRYIRRSELRFLSAAAGSGPVPGTAGTGQAVFFQAPLSYTESAAYENMESLLNICGFYVEFGSDQAYLPDHVPASSAKYRYRLMQLLVPTEQNNVYRDGTGNGWFSDHVSQARPIADNIIAVVIRPRDPSAGDDEAPNDAYGYDSAYQAMNDPQPVQAHQLPPMVEVVMIAIDGDSALRIDNGSTEPAQITTALEGRFEDRSRFEDDLSGVKAALTAAQIEYRVFSGVIPLRESNWSK